MRTSTCLSRPSRCRQGDPQSALTRVGGWCRPAVVVALPAGATLAECPAFAADLSDLLRSFIHAGVLTPC